MGAGLHVDADRVGDGESHSDGGSGERDAHGQGGHAGHNGGDADENSAAVCRGGG